MRETMIDQLAAQGFTEITVSRTLLGRTRIVAENEKFRREIIYNPATGVILRDFLRVLGRTDDDSDGEKGWGLFRYGGDDDDYDDKDYDDDDYDDDDDDDEDDDD
ncbi:MAG: hypothetical protein HKN02_14725 [Rhodobacteraceae bacterium]|nr:hypothetical protein [Paracoccaceae bacterium]